MFRKEKDILRHLLETSIKVLGCSSGTIAFFDASRSRFVILATLSMAQERLKKPYLSATRGIVAHVLRTGQPLIIDEEHSPPFPRWRNRKRERCSICVPLLDEKGNVTGILTLNKPQGVFPPDTLSFINLLAQEIAIILQQMWLKKEREKVLKKLNSALDTLAKISPLMDRTIYIENLISAGQKLVDATLSVFLDSSDFQKVEFHIYPKAEPSGNPDIQKITELLSRSFKKNFLFKQYGVITLTRKEKALLAEYLPERLSKKLKFLVFYRPHHLGKPFGYFFAFCPFPPSLLAQTAFRSVMDLWAALFGNLLLFQQNLALARKQERLALARELHDGLTQDIAGLQLHFQLIREMLKKEDIKLSKETLSLMERTERGLSASLERSRDILKNLREATIPNLPLREEIQQALMETFIFSKVKTKVKANVKTEELTPRLREAIMALIREAARNVEKHAQATKVKVKVGLWKDHFYVIFKDNGKGFNVSRMIAEETGQGYGLKGIQGTVALLQGAFRVSSKEDRGTILKAVIPRSG
ncbi:GAF domain-containing sensor histidine kinase [Thermatribacter velox]|uniref:GAF domain-containing sensor histidine kinase n=1 Tax=Thermatribacter velox TaxID=3039681 RepID=UPI0034D9845B